MENRQLKAQIVLLFGCQADMAQATGLPEARISKIIHGRIKPSSRERRIFAKVFGPERVDSLLGYLSSDTGALYTYPTAPKKSPEKF